MYTHKNVPILSLGSFTSVPMSDFLILAILSTHVDAEHVARATSTSSLPDMLIGYLPLDDGPS